MSEPAVPVINPDVLKAKPEPSGACPSKAMLLMFLAGPAIAVVYGVLAHYLGLAVGWLCGLIARLPELLVSIFIFVICPGTIIAIFVILAAVVIYSGFMGIGMGEIIAALARQGNCRNPTMVGLAGAISGIFAYAVHVLIVYLVAGAFSSMITNTATIAKVFLSTMEGTPWWMFALMGFEFVTITGVAAFFASNTNQDDLFCEPHGIWYDSWKEANYSLDLASAIAESLEASQVRGLENVNIMDKVTRPFLKVRSRRCPSSAACELQFKVELNWQETTVDDKGHQKTENKDKVWVDTMLPPSFGFALESALQLDEATTAKK